MLLRLAPFAIIVLAAPRAAAQERGVDFTWARAPGAESCIDEAELRTRVRERFDRDPFAPPHGYAIDGTVAREGEAWVVELLERDAAREPRVLRTEGDDCRALDEALVLALSLAIQAEAAAIAEPAPCAPAPVPAPCPPPAPRDTTDVTLVAGAMGAIDLVPGAAAGWTIRASARLHELVSLELGAFSFPEARTGSDVTLGIGLSAGGVGACLHPEIAPDVRLAGCVAIYAGAIHAVVHRPLPLDPGDRFWIAASLAGQLAWFFVPPVGVWIELAAVVPFLRYEFRSVDRTEPEFVELPVIPWAAVGLALRFG